MSDRLKEEAKRIEELLAGKSISEIYRPRKNKICLEFSDGMRFSIDSSVLINLKFSITDS